MTILLVEDGELDRHLGEFDKPRRRIGRLVLAVLKIQVNQLVTMHSVERQQDQHDEVRNQQRQVKRVGVVQPLKRRVEKMRAQIVPESARFRQHGAQHHERSVQELVPLEKSPQLRKRAQVDSTTR